MKQQTLSSLNYAPFSVGFDRTFKVLSDMVDNFETRPSYPPYNIVKTSEDQYQIELAVAGFGMSDLDVEIKDSILTVTGNNRDDEREFIHRGIAGRAFTRTFTLADTIEVLDADLQNGILVIRLKNVIPEHKKPRKLMIGQTQLPENVMLSG